jgi:hypothetical protein
VFSAQEGPNHQGQAAKPLAASGDVKIDPSGGRGGEKGLAHQLLSTRMRRQAEDDRDDHNSFSFFL